MVEQNQHRAVFEFVSEPLLLLQEGRITDCNVSALALFGCKREQLVAHSLLKFSPATQRDGRASTQVLQEQLAAVQSAETQRFEWLQQRLNGEMFEAEVTLRRLDPVAGDEALILVSIQDISERKRTQQGLQETEALKRRNRELATLYDAATAISSNLAFEVVLRTVARQMTQALNSSGCALSLWDRAQNRVETLAEYSTTEPGETESPGITYDLNDYPATRQVLESNRPLLIHENDPTADEAERALMKEQEVKTLLMLPLAARDQVLGLVELFDEEEGRDYKPEEIRLAQSLAAQAAVSVENARLYDQAQQEIRVRKQLAQKLQESLERRARQVRTSTEVAQEIATAPALDDLFRRVVNLVQERFGYYHAHVYALTEDNLVMQGGSGEAGQKLKEVGHQIPLAADRSLVARAAREGESVLAPDVSQEPGWLPNPLLPETKSELAVPIKLGREVLGVLDVQSNAVGGVDEEDQILLMGLCGQIAVAVHNRRADAERIQAEANLREAEARYRTLVEQLPAITYIVAFGEVNRTMYISPQVGSLLGFSPAEWLADPDLWLKQLHPDDREWVLAEVNRKDGLGEPLDLEYRALTRDGQVLWFHNQSVLVRDQTGQLRYSHGIMFDITERKHSEQALQRRTYREQTIGQITEKMRGATSLEQLVKTAAEGLGERLSAGHTVVELGFEPSRATDNQDLRS